MKKGFISSSLVYTFLIMFLFITLAIITYDLNKEKLLGYIIGEAKEEIKNPEDIPSILIGDVFGYDYTGDVQTFTAPVTGIYQIELWGAQGGSGPGASGGYVSGQIFLTVGEKLYVYVGQKNDVANETAFNGGTGTYGGTPGGGATDVRLISGSWSDLYSLKSRIMIAGGGGSGQSTGYGGGLTGNNGGVATAGTQITFGVQEHIYGNGSFGIGGGGCGGGGGYYGGGGGACVNGGGGGSSFISGHNGSNALNEIGIHSGDSTHISGKIFFNTIMIDGSGKAWKDTVIDFMQMPKPDGTLYDWASGHTGNGFAKITYISSTDYSSFDVNNYSNNGLILMYDGINNGGIGVHNDNSSPNRGVWTDLSGNNNHGTLTSFGYTSTSGWSDNSLRFDGVDDVIELGNQLINLFKSSATIEITLKFDELAARDIIFGNYSGVSTGINWEKHTINQGRFYWNGGLPDTQTAAIYNNTNIMQTSLIFDRTNNKIKVLVNSVERHSNIDSRYGTDTLDYTNAYIGRDIRTGETALKGNIYNIRVYNRVLSSSEIMHNLLIDKLRFGF